MTLCHQRHNPISGYVWQDIRYFRNTLACSALGQHSRMADIRSTNPKCYHVERGVKGKLPDNHLQQS